jgi:hypothetical protein
VSHAVYLGHRSLAVHTFGTTSLNHGFGDSNSENQSAVAEPTSLDRLRISHSASLSDRVCNHAGEVTLEMNTSVGMVSREIF